MFVTSVKRRSLSTQTTRLNIPEDSHLIPRRRKKVNSRLILVMLLKTWFVLFVYQNARDMYIFCGGNELPGYTEAVGARLALSPPREANAPSFTERKFDESVRPTSNSDIASRSASYAWPLGHTV